MLTSERKDRALMCFLRGASTDKVLKVNSGLSQSFLFLVLRAWLRHCVVAKKAFCFLWFSTFLLLNTSQSIANIPPNTSPNTQKKLSPQKGLKGCLAILFQHFGL